MSRFYVLVKTGLKLLLRNKGFLFFLIVLPILALLLLNIKINSKEYNIETNDEKEVIRELELADSKIVYLADASKFSVKVYDSSNSKLSDYVLNNLAAMGIFEIYRYHSEDMSEEEIFNLAKENAMNDRIGVILYIKPNFEKGLFLGEIENAMTVFGMAEDDRCDLFRDSLNETMTVLAAYAKEVNSDKNKLEEYLDKAEEAYPQKTIVTVNLNEGKELSTLQESLLSNIGFSISILGLAFLFSGVFIAWIVIEERNNGIFMRITLSNIANWEYIVSKLVISVMITIIQTILIGISLPILVHVEIGINRFSYLAMIFMLGLIFNTLSLCVGTMIGNVMTTNFVTFLVWTMSSLLSGVYLQGSGKIGGVIDPISKLTPQKWFLEGVKMLMRGEKHAYLTMISVTAAFLIVIMSIGAAGLKFKREV